MRRTLLQSQAMVIVAVFSATALAFECTNASKSDPAAGAQIIFGVTTNRHM